MNELMNECMNACMKGNVGMGGEKWVQGGRCQQQLTYLLCG